MIKPSNCKHEWVEYQIGCFPYIYRKCLNCDRNEFLELPMGVWKYMMTYEELMERKDRTGKVF